MTVRRLVVLCAFFFCAGCNPANEPAKTATPAAASDPGAIGAIEEVSGPASMGSGEPNLSTGASGKTYMTWIETTDAHLKIVKFAVKTPEGWSEPRTIAQSYNMFVNWADVPSLFEVSEGSLAAHWQESLPNADEGYNIQVAVSRDDGKTWSKPVKPHRDNKKGEHGFVSLAAMDKGVSVMWLDSRKATDESGDYALMQTKVDLDGKLSPESEVDPRVCECCQPTAIAASGGMLAVYRDRTAEEIRDIVVSRFEGGKWSEPKTVFDDKWKIEACPIQGPAVSVAGDNLAVAWFTAANDKPKVQVALSKDGGKSFGAPVQVDGGNPLGRVDVATLDSGGAVVTWIEHGPSGGEVRAREVGPGGQKHDAHTVAKTTLGNESGFPRIERSGGSVVFAWTDTEGGRVKTAVAKLSSGK